MWLTVRSGGVGLVGVVVLHGELDLATQPALERGLAVLLRGGYTRVVADLGGVGFADLSGLRPLVRAQRQVRSDGGWLRLAGPPRSARRILAVTDLGDILPVYPDVYEAFADRDGKGVPPVPRDGGQDGMGDRAGLPQG